MSAPAGGRAPRDTDALLAAAAILLSAALTGFGSGRWEFLLPAGLGLLALPFAPAPARRSFGIVAYALLTMPLVLLYQTATTKLQGIGQTQFHGTFYSAVYCCSAAVLTLYEPAASRQRGVRAILWAATGLCFAGVAYPGWLERLPSWRQATGMGERAPHPHTVLMLAAAVQTALLGLVLRRELVWRDAPRAGGVWRAAALGLCFTVALGSGGAISWGIRASYEDVSRLFFDLMRGVRLQATGGFSDAAELGSVMSSKGVDGGRTVALRAFGKDRPGYLRGKVFQTYRGRGWEAGKDKRSIEAGETGRVTFPGRAPAKGAAEPAWRIVTATRYNAVYFTPQRASTVESAAARLFLYSGNVLRSQDAPTTQGYRVWLDPAPLRREGERKEWLELPQDPELVAALDEHIARAGLRGLPLPLVLRKLADHFEANYAYEFGITFKDTPDPLVQFLREKEHGHCELFASSGALMLRRLGFPARYVTGFVCDEKNSYDEELWIARNGGAHAWVEVYDPAHGWLLAEFTPSAGLPQSSSPGGFESFLDWLRGQWERLKAIPWRELPVRAAFAIRAGLDWILAAWWRIALAVALLGLWAWRRLRGRGAAGPVASTRAFPAEVASLRAEFLALEARLAGQGLGRPPAETLLEYAARLGAGAPLPQDLVRAEVVSAVERFALARYGPGATGS
ncbi:MAG: DUF3488 and DUF4129 domain-containing transglutaminase family protein [Planctomycetota bacterium]